MKKTFNLLTLLLLAVAMLTTGCKKETTTANIDLMEGAVEYTGTYPAPQEVTFTDNGISATINAYPGQAIVYFKTGVNETDATQVITSNGGTVLAKIPASECYFVETGTGQFTGFFTALQANNLVELAFPNVELEYYSVGSIIDGCSTNHGAKVQSNFTYCGGSFNGCFDNSVEINGKLIPMPYKNIFRIAQIANEMKTGPTLINLSSGGSIGKKWSAMTPTEREVARKAWLNSMKVLFEVYKLPAAYKQNLVVTVATGNADMPITDLLEELKSNAKLAEVIKNNVVFVSNTSTPILKGNYSATDPDVVVLDTSSTPDAYSGTSYSAPCALGLMQRLIDEKGVTVKEAITLVKTASLLDPKRVVRWEILEELAGSARYVSGPLQLTGYANLDCSWKFQYAFDLVVVNWNGSQGSLYMPATLSVILLADPDGICNNDPAPRTSIMSGNLSGSNTAITGTIEGWHFVPNQVYPVTLKFTGYKSGSNLIGTLQGDGIYPFPQTVQFTLNQQ